MSTILYRSVKTVFGRLRLEVAKWLGTEMIKLDKARDPKPILEDKNVTE